MRGFLSAIRLLTAMLLQRSSHSPTQVRSCSVSPIPASLSIRSQTSDSFNSFRTIHFRIATDATILREQHLVLRKYMLLSRLSTEACLSIAVKWQVPVRKNEGITRGARRTFRAPSPPNHYPAAPLESAECRNFRKTLSISRDFTLNSRQAAVQ
jgi:hypothetical protein